MYLARLLSSGVLISLAHSATAGYDCKQFYVPLHIDSPSLTPNFMPFDNQLQSVALLNRFTAKNLAALPPLLGARTNIPADFTISAYYCTPQKESKEVTQILTHGVGYDHTYWTWGGPRSQYNYVKAATDAGFPVFLYDRLGTGLSTKSNPYTELQLDVETEVLAHLTQGLQSGTLSKYSRYHIPKPSKIVHVGHSFGSVITQNLIASHPSISDGVILTGFSTAGAATRFGSIFISSTGFHVAADNQPDRFQNYSKGYLTWGDVLSNQYAFFHYPNFDPSVLDKSEKTKQPFGVGEVLTQGPVEAKDYCNPLLILSGSYDQIFCDADCNGILEKARSFYPKAKPFDTYQQPDTGHALNLHKNSTGTYRVILDFVQQHISL